MKYIIYALLELLTALVALILISSLIMIIFEQQNYFLQFVNISPTLIGLCLTAFLAFVLIFVYLGAHYNESYNMAQFIKCCKRNI